MAPSPVILNNVNVKVHNTTRKSPKVIGNKLSPPRRKTSTSKTHKIRKPSLLLPSFTAASASDDEPLDFVDVGRRDGGKGKTNNKSSKKCSRNKILGNNNELLQSPDEDLNHEKRKFRLEELQDQRLSLLKTWPSNSTANDGSNNGTESPQFKLKTEVDPLLPNSSHNERDKLNPKFSPSSREEQQVGWMNFNNVEFEPENSSAFQSKSRSRAKMSKTSEKLSVNVRGKLEKTIEKQQLTLQNLQEEMKILTETLQKSIKNFKTAPIKKKEGKIGDKIDTPKLVTQFPQAQSIKHLPMSSKAPTKTMKTENLAKLKLANQDPSPTGVNKLKSVTSDHPKTPNVPKQNISDILKLARAPSELISPDQKTTAKKTASQAKQENLNPLLPNLKPPLEHAVAPATSCTLREITAHFRESAMEEPKASLVDAVAPSIASPKWQELASRAMSASASVARTGSHSTVVGVNRRGKTAVTQTVGQRHHRPLTKATAMQTLKERRPAVAKIPLKTRATQATLVATISPSTDVISPRRASLMKTADAGLAKRSVIDSNVPRNSNNNFGARGSHGTTKDNNKVSEWTGLAALARSSRSQSSSVSSNTKKIDLRKINMEGGILNGSQLRDFARTHQDLSLLIRSSGIRGRGHKFKTATHLLQESRPKSRKAPHTPSTTPTSNFSAVEFPGSKKKNGALVAPNPSFASTKRLKKLNPILHLEYQKLIHERLPIIWVLGFPPQNIVSNVNAVLETLSTNVKFPVINLEKQIAKWVEAPKVDSSSPWVSEAVVARAQKIVGSVPEVSFPGLSSSQVIELLQLAMLNLRETEIPRGFIIYGFPAHPDEGLAFESKFGKCSLALHFQSGAPPAASADKFLPKYFIRKREYTEEGVDDTVKVFGRVVLKITNAEALEGPKISRVAKLIQNKLFPS